MPELNKVLESLSNRELAFLFWAGLLLLCVLCSASLRKHLASILRLAFGSKLTLYFTLVAGYTIGIAYVLEKYNWWDLTQLKNTVLWYFTVGVFSLADITNQKKSNYFKAALRDLLGITALLQFAIGVYSFSFIKELLLLPLLVLLGGMQVVAERTSKYQAAARLVSYLLSFFGLFLTGYTLYRMVGDFKSIANEGTLNDFLIPALFSFLFLPLLYFLSILVTHDDAFALLKRELSDPSVRRYARWKALLHFHIHKHDLNRWRQFLFLHPVYTRQDVRKSIAFIQQLKRRERNPPLVDQAEGWSPYAAKSFLATAGIPTGFYQPTADWEWMACSEYCKLDGEIASNLLSYYVVGNEAAATQLTLTLHVHNRKQEAIALSRFLDTVTLLYGSALQIALPDDVKEAIITRKNLNLTAGTKHISLRWDKWKEHRAGGYSLCFYIKRCS